MFELHYEPLSLSEHRSFGEIAVIPWDTETFGFKVSVLKPCYDAGVSWDDAEGIQTALNSYSTAQQVRLITSSIPTEHLTVSLLLERAGFCLVDIALSVRYEGLRDIANTRQTKLSLTQALPCEFDRLIQMAGQAFQHGRYHLDPWFPVSMADQRYRDWLHRCLAPDNSQRLLTVRYDEVVCGFSVVECKGEKGYLHLHAIDSEWQGRGLGRQMILESLRYLHQLGAACVDTKISASNLRALSMHSRLGGQFTAAERLLHWHRTANSCH